MAYGIEIRNSDNIIILDNNPRSVLYVVETGTLASGSVLATNLDPNALLFIRPTTTGASIYGNFVSPFSNSITINATSGTITYVKIKTCAAITPAGYGIAIYDNTGSPSLVFTDSIQFVRIAASIGSNLSSTLNISTKANLPGKYKYIDAYALGRIHSWQTGYDTVQAAFNSDGSIITLSALNHSQSFYSGTDVITTRRFNIIEC